MNESAGSIKIILVWMIPSMFLMIFLFGLVERWVLWTTSLCTWRKKKTEHKEPLLSFKE